MVETEVSELEGERLRYNGDTWELTGTLEVKRNGELIKAHAKKPERVRGSGGRFIFTLDTSPASIYPGNLGELSCTLTEVDDGYGLIVERGGSTDRYGLTKLTYE